MRLGGYSITEKERNSIANKIEDNSKELLRLKKKRKRQEDTLHQTRKEISWIEQSIQRNKNLLNNN